MKLLTFTEDEAAELIAKLELDALRARQHASRELFAAIDDLHRTMHYHVVQWLQARGADARRS